MGASLVSWGAEGDPTSLIRGAMDKGPSSSDGGSSRPPAGLFPHQLLVYGADGFSAATTRSIGRALRTRSVAVYLRDVDVPSGQPTHPDIPVQALTADAVEYARAAGLPRLAPLLAHGAVLARTESTLRHLTTGDVLHLSDRRQIRVSGVVEDHVLGGAEISLPLGFGQLRGIPAAYLLLDHQGRAAAMTAQVRRALPGLALRVETTTANGYLSAADSVLTQLQVKARFGEFAVRRTGGTTFSQDARWMTGYLRTERVPQLGTVTGNVRMLPALVAAMREVTARGLGSTVHTADFQYEGGCWNPNIVPGGAGTVSRHSWGVAVDINVDSNPFGRRPRQDARLVALMARHGFAWGGRWLRPDAMHFEYVGPALR